MSDGYLISLLFKEGRTHEDKSEEKEWFNLEKSKRSFQDIEETGGASFSSFTHPSSFFPKAHESLSGKTLEETRHNDLSVFPAQASVGVYNGLLLSEVFGEEPLQPAPISEKLKSYLQPDEYLEDNSIQQRDISNSPRYHGPSKHVHTMLCRQLPTCDNTSSDSLYTVYNSDIVENPALFHNNNNNYCLNSTFDVQEDYDSIEKTCLSIPESTTSCCFLTSKQSSDKYDTTTSSRNVNNDQSEDSKTLTGFCNIPFQFSEVCSCNQWLQIPCLKGTPQLELDMYKTNQLLSNPLSESFTKFSDMSTSDPPQFTTRITVPTACTNDLVHSIEVPVTSTLINITQPDDTCDSIFPSWSSTQVDTSHITIIPGSNSLLNPSVTKNTIQTDSQSVSVSKQQTPPRDIPPVVTEAVCQNVPSTPLIQRNSLPFLVNPTQSVNSRHIPINNTLSNSVPMSSRLGIPGRSILSSRCAPRQLAAAAAAVPAKICRKLRITQTSSELPSDTSHRRLPLESSSFHASPISKFNPSCILGVIDSVQLSTGIHRKRTDDAHDGLQQCIETVNNSEYPLVSDMTTNTPHSTLSSHLCTKTTHDTTLVIDNQLNESSTRRHSSQLSSQHLVIRPQINHSHASNRKGVPLVNIPCIQGALSIRQHTVVVPRPPESTHSTHHCSSKNVTRGTVSLSSSSSSISPSIPELLDQTIKDKPLQHHTKWALKTQLRRLSSLSTTRRNTSRDKLFDTFKTNPIKRPIDSKNKLSELSNRQCCTHMVGWKGHTQQHRELSWVFLQSAEFIHHTLNNQLLQHQISNVAHIQTHHLKNHCLTSQCHLSEINLPPPSSFHPFYDLPRQTNNVGLGVVLGTGDLIKDKRISKLGLDQYMSVAQSIRRISYTFHLLFFENDSKLNSIIPSTYSMNPLCLQHQLHHHHSNLLTSHLKTSSFHNDSSLLSCVPGSNITLFNIPQTSIPVIKSLSNELSVPQSLVTVVPSTPSTHPLSFETRLPQLNKGVMNDTLIDEAITLDNSQSSIHTQLISEPTTNIVFDPLIHSTTHPQQNQTLQNNVSDNNGHVLFFPHDATCLNKQDATVTITSNKYDRESTLFTACHSGESFHTETHINSEANKIMSDPLPCRAACWMEILIFVQSILQLQLRKRTLRRLNILKRRQQQHTHRRHHFIPDMSQDQIIIQTDHQMNTQKHLSGTVYGHQNDQHHHHIPHQLSDVTSHQLNIQPHTISQQSIQSNQISDITTFLSTRMSQSTDIVIKEDESLDMLLSSSYWIVFVAFLLERRLHTIAIEQNNSSLLEQYCCCRLFYVDPKSATHTNSLYTFPHCYCPKHYPNEPKSYPVTPHINHHTSNSSITQKHIISTSRSEPHTSHCPYQSSFYDDVCYSTKNSTIMSHYPSSPLTKQFSTDLFDPHILSQSFTNVQSNIESTPSLSSDITIQPNSVLHSNHLSYYKHTVNSEQQHTASCINTATASVVNSAFSDLNTTHTSLSSAEQHNALYNPCCHLSSHQMSSIPTHYYLNKTMEERHNNTQTKYNSSGTVSLDSSCSFVPKQYSNPHPHYSTNSLPVLQQCCCHMTEKDTRLLQTEITKDNVNYPCLKERWGPQIDTIRRFLVLCFCAWSWIEDETITSGSMVAILQHVWWCTNTQISFGLSDTAQQRSVKNTVYSPPSTPNMQHNTTYSHTLDHTQHQQDLRETKSFMLYQKMGRFGVQRIKDVITHSSKTRLLSLRDQLTQKDSAKFKHPNETTQPCKTQNTPTFQEIDDPQPPPTDFYAEYLALPTCCSTGDFEYQVFFLLKQLDYRLAIVPEDLETVASLWRDILKTENCCIQHINPKCYLSTAPDAK